MAMSNQYTLYHLHSDLSNGVTNIDSVTKYGEYIERAKECGMKAMAFTEHGSVFEWWHKKSATFRCWLSMRFSAHAPMRTLPKRTIRRSMLITLLEIRR